MNDILIIATLALSAFFAGMEAAFLHSDKLLIELDRKHGALGSEIVRLFTDHPRRLFATTLIGKTVSVVSFIAVFSFRIQYLFSFETVNAIAQFLLALAISTLAIFFVTEFLAVILFSAFPNFFLKTLSIPTLFFFLIFYPFASLLATSSVLITRVFKKSGYKPDEINEKIFSKPETDHLLIPDNKSDENSLSENQNILILRNALDFSNVKLREIMVPRTEIEAIEINSSAEYIKEKFISTRYSRILAFNGTIDNITGYVEVKDIFKSPKDIKSALRKITIVPETMAANKLLRKFVNEKINIALVVDEFGGTSGMVTIEDLLEQIVGDIEDEHDIKDLVEKQTGPNEYVLSGRLEIDYLNEKYNLGLPEENDYETLAGLILFFHGSIPGNNETLRIGNYRIKILRSTPTRLELVNLLVEESK